MQLLSQTHHSLPLPLLLFSPPSTLHLSFLLGLSFVSSDRPRSRSRDGGEENENIQERHFRPHFLQAPGDLIVQEGRLCRMDCKVRPKLDL